MNIYECLQYDRKNRLFSYGSKKFFLSSQKEVLMCLFLRFSEQVVTYERIKFELWGDYNFTKNGRNVRSNVQLLKRDLPADLAVWIHNVRGVGYILMKDL